MFYPIKFSHGIWREKRLLPTNILSQGAVEKNSDVLNLQRVYFVNKKRKKERKREQENNQCNVRHFRLVNQ